MEGDKISCQFPQYLFTAEIVDDKLVMVGEEATYSLHFLNEINNPLNKSICSFNTRLSLILFFFFFAYADLHNSRREGCNLQKNQQEDLTPRDSTRLDGKEAAEGEAWQCLLNGPRKSVAGPHGYEI